MSHYNIENDKTGFKNVCERKCDVNYDVYITDINRISLFRMKNCINVNRVVGGYQPMLAPLTLNPMIKLKYNYC